MDIHTMLKLHFGLVPCAVFVSLENFLMAYGNLVHIHLVRIELVCIELGTKKHGLSCN